MKRILLSIALVFSTVSVLDAQQYFDKDWKGCSQDRAYYVAVPNEGKASEYVVRTIEKGKLSSGKGELSQNYSIYRTSDFKNGEMVSFTADDDTVEVKNYVKGKLHGDYKFWRKDHGLYKKAVFSEGKEDGITEYFFPNGQISARYVMNKGKEKEGEFWNSNGSKVQDPKTANVKPAFMGKDENTFLRWVTERLVYPLECKKDNIEGTVVVSFRIGKDGKIQDVIVIQSPHYLLSAEALRVIDYSPDWTPGIWHNQNTVVRYTVPVIFRLANSRK